jgi:hypothetical protein
MKKFVTCMLTALLIVFTCVAPRAQSYSLSYTVADMRLSNAESGGSACPQQNHWDPALSGGINLQWSTVLPSNPAEIITESQTPSGQVAEIQSVIAQSFGVWTGVAGTTLTPSSLGPLNQTTIADACVSSDGLNTICFDQADPSFTTGVIAFTRITTADFIGDQPAPNQPPATFVGEIVDADILVNPGTAGSPLATPAALPANPQAYDLESALIHEMGYFFGLADTDVWSAAMFPFLPAPGTYLGTRPTTQMPDAPLSDDDRTGLRVLYPDPSNTVYVGTIGGRIVPANPLSLVSQPGVTGIFAAQVVAVDNAGGSVVAATQAGWSCSAPGPAVFDGSYSLQALPVSATQAYEIYVEPFTGPESSSDVANNLASLCRNSTTDANWPAAFACVVPAVNVNFTAAVLPPD